jgi:UDP-N-acetylmuramate dehydrogenase
MNLVDPFRGLETMVERDVMLSRHTWYRIGGAARYFVTPRDVDELRAAVGRCREHEIPIYVLGRGANLLVADEGVDGAVFRFVGGVWEDVQIDGVRVRVGAGADFAKLIVQVVRAGLAGIEGLAGIPGSMGGIVRMNAGGKWGEIGAVVESVDVMDDVMGDAMDDAGDVQTIERHEMSFSYRSANLSQRFILGATLELHEDDPDEIARRYREVWMYKRTTQPLNTKNAGCVFRNPGGGRSAGALIDAAGLKGMRIGGAEVSDRHANFFVAHPGCKASDVMQLIKHVQQRVLDHAGVTLEPEVRMWPSRL